MNKGKHKIENKSNFEIQLTVTWAWSLGDYLSTLTRQYVSPFYCVVITQVIVVVKEDAAGEDLWTYTLTHRC